MNLQEIFDTLVSSEFNNHPKVTDGQFDKDYYNTLITVLNLGIIDIHKLVHLKTDYVEVPLISGTKIYEITQSNLIEILEIEDSKGIIIPMNNKPNFTQEYQLDYFNGFYAELLSENKFKLGNYNFADKVTVKIKATADRINRIETPDLDTVILSTINVNLPHTALNALTQFVASKLFMSKDAQGILGKSPFHVGNDYKQKYDKAINELLVYGYDVGQSYGDTKFADNGFV